MGTKLSYTSSMTKKDGKAKGVIKTGVTLTRFTDSLGKVHVIRHIYRKRELYGGGSKKG